MITKPVKEKGFDAQSWFPVGFNVMPNGSVGFTMGLFHSQDEWVKSSGNSIAEQGLQVTVSTKVLMDLMSASQQATVADPASPFFGCPWTPDQPQ